MFGWYESAIICYVYLSDVSVLANRSYRLENVDMWSAIGFPWEKEIKYTSEGCIGYSSKSHRMSTDYMWLLLEGSPQFWRSRWFSRGWTLQELIAPKLLMFFGRGWRVIGDRESFAEALEGITKVSPMVLGKPGNLADFSIAERMFWAAHRQTTRPEDEAYSLLGISA